MERVLVAGASGYLGRYVVQACKERGYWVRALARAPERLQGLEPYLDDVVIAQVTQAESLAGCCDTIDVVVSSIGITRQKDGLTFDEVDYGGNHNLLERAVAAGVKRFVYVSVFDADAMPALKAVQAKQRFTRELEAAPLGSTVVCPTGCFSDMLEYLAMARKGFGVLFNRGQARINPVHGADVAAVCADAATGGPARIDVGGPEVFSHEEILRLAFRVAGRKPRMLRVPEWMRRGLLGLLRRLAPARVYGPVEFVTTVLARDMVAPPHGRHRLEAFYRGQAPA